MSNALNPIHGRVRKWMMIVTGASSVVAGILTFWLPLPIGLPLMLLGATLLARHSPRARLWSARVRGRASALWRERKDR